MDVKLQTWLVGRGIKLRGLSYSGQTGCISSRMELLAKVVSWEIQHPWHSLVLVTHKPPWASPLSAFFFCLCRMSVNVQLCTFATCHENYSMTLNLSVNHSSKQTTERNARTAPKLLFTCLVTARPLIDLGGGGPELHRGAVTWQGLDIYYFRARVTCWNEAQNSYLRLWLQDHQAPCLNIYISSTSAAAKSNSRYSSTTSFPPSSYFSSKKYLDISKLHFSKTAQFIILSNR